MFRVPRISNEAVTILKDAVLALNIALRTTAPGLLTAWLYVPIGILAILAVCFGADTILRVAGFSFPASVACLLILFFALLLSEWLLGSNRTRRVVAVLDVPCGWALRWINVLFTPTFIQLPLSSPISGVEVGKIIAVFVIGFIAMMVITAYMTRGLQLLTGSSKRAEAERAEELGDDESMIPLTRVFARDDTSPLSQSSATSAEASTATLALPNLPSPPRAQDPSVVRNQDMILDADAVSAGLWTPPPPSVAQTPPAPPRARLWAAHISSRIDWIIYGALFIFAGLPVYSAVGYAMPLQLTFTILAYFASLAVPLHWRQYLHPVLVSSLVTVLGLWVLGLIRGQDLHAILAEYRVGLKYLQLWDGTPRAGQLPGAGDMLGSVLDASIVSLALPMYQYRRELREHFVAVIVPNIVISIGTLFFYPWFCYLIGISAARSLALAGRSLTLALAIPVVDNLGGDTQTVGAVAIMSGIVGALIGTKMLTWLKIPEDDYVTRGVTLGANSSAVATAALLRTDPRAAALSSLSMSLFGAVTVLFTAIPPLASIIKSFVDE